MTGPTATAEMPREIPDGLVHTTHTTMVAPVEVAAVAQPISEPIDDLATVLKSVERGYGERDGQGATPLKTDLDRTLET